MLQTPHPQNGHLITGICEVLGPQFDPLVVRDEGRHQGPRQKIREWQLVVGLVAQQVQFHGCLAAGFGALFGVDLTAAVLRARRTKLGLEPFASVVRHALRPLADPRRHDDCFFAGLRLLGLDGSTLSVRNTPQNNARVKKAHTRRGLAACGKVGLCALVLVGPARPGRRHREPGGRERTGPGHPGSGATPRAQPAHP